MELWNKKVFITEGKLVTAKLLKICRIWRYLSLHPRSCSATCPGRGSRRLVFRVLTWGSRWCCATHCHTLRTPLPHHWCRRGLLSCSTAIPTPLTQQEVGGINILINYSFMLSSTLFPLSCFCGQGNNVTVPSVTVFPDRVDVALSPEHMSRPPPEAPPCAPPCAPPITPPSPGPGAPGWEREVVCIQPSRSTTPPESLEHPTEEPRNVSAQKHTPAKLKLWTGQ